MEHFEPIQEYLLFERVLYDIQKGELYLLQYEVQNIRVYVTENLLQLFEERKETWQISTHHIVHQSQ